MKSYRKQFLIIAVLFWQAGSVMAQTNTVASPDGQVKAEFFLEDGRPFYTLRLNEKPLLVKSPLGLVCADADFTENLTLKGFSKMEIVLDDYTMPLGKKSRIRYQAHRRIATLENPQGRTVEILFQVSNDGLAFRYHFPAPAGQRLTVEREATGFAFTTGTVSWLHPLHDSKTGWEKTFPSYESHYEIEKPVGLPSHYSAGWAFPALFRVKDDG